jgi:hypothetical protein
MIATNIAIPRIILRINNPTKFLQFLEINVPVPVASARLKTSIRTAFACRETLSNFTWKLTNQIKEQNIHYIER